MFASLECCLAETGLCHGGRRQWVRCRQLARERPGQGTQAGRGHTVGRCDDRPEWHRRHAVGRPALGTTIIGKSRPENGKQSEGWPTKGRAANRQLSGRRRSGRESLGRGDVFREKGVGRVPGKDEAENGALERKKALRRAPCPARHGTRIRPRTVGLRSYRVRQ